jgi:cobaltochelatase CobT
MENYILPLLLVVAFLGVIEFGIQFFRKGKRSKKPVEDGPESEPYRIYTAEFDVDIHANRLAENLAVISPDHEKGNFEFTDIAWNAQIDQANAILATLEQNDHPALPQLEDTAILIFVDQSGSMRGEPMAWAAASLRGTVRHLASAGASVAIAGYTTAGWQGGFARQKWIKDSRPQRPGRLCALLHISYKEFAEQTWDDASWRMMLNPNILRENVDGESLLWAQEKLNGRPEKHKILLVISDGAPVDDATLLHNGPHYLWRHFRQVVSNIESQDSIRLLEIAVHHQDKLGYARGKMVKVGDNLAEVICDAIIG